MKRTTTVAMGVLCVGLGLGFHSPEAQANRCAEECFITWRACYMYAIRLPEPDRSFELASCTAERAACDEAAQQCPPDPTGLLWQSKDRLGSDPSAPALKWGGPSRRSAL